MTTILGIRHHGPGSARSVLAELERLQPDTLLVEGPSDASDLIGLIADPGMRPPVALLVYAPDEPRVATFYPFAEFSPEWVALRWALEHDIPARFIDLSAGAQMAVAKAEFERRMAEAVAAAKLRTTEAGEGTDLESELVRHDPLTELAHAAGEEDGERFWDRLVESRREPGDLFAAVSEAMTAVRGAVPEEDSLTLQREAADAPRHPRGGKAGLHERRRRVRRLARARAREAAVRRRGRSNAEGAAEAPEDRGRLGAVDVRSPGRASPATAPASSRPAGTRTSGPARSRSPSHGWRASRALFREEGMDASAAHLVEAVRLAETLAAMRGRAAPSLSELNEAVRACLAMGSDLPSGSCATA